MTRYLSIFFSLLLLGMVAGCSPESVGPSDNPLVGKWQATLIEEYSIADSSWHWISNVDSVEFTFRVDGYALYTSPELDYLEYDWRITASRLVLIPHWIPAGSEEYLSGSYPYHAGDTEFYFDIEHDPPLHNITLTRHRFHREY